MTTTVTRGKTIVTDAAQQMPCISIVLPFNPAMSQKDELVNALKLASNAVETELYLHYAEDIALGLMQKLNNIFRKLNFYVNKKSIAIFVSPVVEKVFYLDMLVDARVKVAETCGIKEVINCKKQVKQFLLLHVTGEGFKIYVGNNGQLIKIVSAPHTNPGLSRGTATTEQLSPARAAIQHIDQTLDIILQTYKMPLFVAAADYFTNQLKSYSRFNQNIINYIPLLETEISHNHLQQLATTITADWSKVSALYQQNNMAIAATENKLATGIKAVWKDVMNHKSSILYIERDVECCKTYDTADEVIDKAINPYSCYSYITSPVDEIIAKVLEDGGDVQYASTNSLHNHEHMVLIRK